jgi:T-complex protein 1 subunit alpha
VLVSDPKELEKIRAKELDITRDRIKMIVDAGANVVLTTKGIDDMALKYFVEAGVIACRRVPKDDMRRIAKCTGAKLVMSLADMEGDESFDPACLGSAVRKHAASMCRTQA